MLTRYIPSIAVLMALSHPCAAQEIIAKGLFKNGAILEVNGKQHLLKVGKSTPEGVKLMEANSRQAVIEMNGVKKTLFLSDQIGTQYTPPEIKEVRISASRGNHYVTRGMINNQNIKMLVDTGATSVALSASHAKKLRINYQQGDPISVSTANGVVPAYRIKLRSVSVGGLTVHNVDASVTEGNFPSVVLLGNSYLSRLDYQVESGVLILKQKY